MKNHYHQAAYHTSAQKIAQLPPELGREVAFAGRSNAGKSSAINAICEQKNLAKTSKTPGRTQMINFFRVTEHTQLVDLPGYGYAKVPLALKKHWVQTLEQYLASRQSLCGLLLLMDIRHPLGEHDWQMLNWCHNAQVALLILLTKADKLSRNQQCNSVRLVQKSLEDKGISAQVVAFSAHKRQGLSEVRRTLDSWLGLNQPLNQPQAPAPANP